MKNFGTFTNIVKNSDNFEQAFMRAKNIKNVPQNVADAFYKKYNAKNNLSPEQAFRKFYDEVKNEGMPKINRNQAFETLKKLTRGYELLDKLQNIQHELYFDFDDCMSEENNEFLDKLNDKINEIYSQFERTGETTLFELKKLSA